MPKLKAIVFDLDGTINDSSPGIIHCFKLTGEHYGIYNIPEELLRSGLSGPFTNNLRNILGLKEEQFQEAIKIYTDFYVAGGQWMSQLFPGIKTALETLKSRGYRLGVATMMVDEYAKETLSKYGILEMFDAVHGASFTIPYNKEDLIEQCLYSMDVRPDEAVMIGDGIDDYRASRIAGTEFIGVTYGYGLTERVCKENGIRYADEPGKITDLI